MDLDRFPRCGGEWVRGAEKCPFCQFVPIGAGLKAPTAAEEKKKKKKYRRYAEPGSSKGFLSLIFLGLIGYGAVRYQPWQDDWEMIRSLFGQGRHHSLVGNWEVVKTVASEGEQGLVARDNVKKGLIEFSDKGKVTFSLVHPQSETKASGTYLVSGTQLAFKGLEGSGDGADQFPASLNMSLAWTGADDVVAMDKTEAIYLHRKKSNVSLSTFMQVGLKKKGGEELKDAPELRGIFGDVKREADKTEKMINATDEGNQ